AVFEKLQQATEPGAFYNSSNRFDLPKCHPNTRIAVLERFMHWILASDDREVLIMWLYGPAGSGKSAIAQTIAERCFTFGILARFFFRLSDPARNRGDSLIPTIAYQVATTIPETRVRLESVIERDP
ncbi:hypothetical protein BDZ97DRAFT_1632957, partial [Flammula alnicola]